MDAKTRAKITRLVQRAATAKGKALDNANRLRTATTSTASERYMNRASDYSAQCDAALEEIAALVSIAPASHTSKGGGK